MVELQSGLPSVALAATARPGDTCTNHHGRGPPRQPGVRRAERGLAQKLARHTRPRFPARHARADDVAGGRHPNSLAPRKRPRTTLSPTVVLRDGEPYLAFGTPAATGRTSGRWRRSSGSSSSVWTFSGRRRPPPSTPTTSPRRSRRGPAGPVSWSSRRRMTTPQSSTCRPAVTLCRSSRRNRSAARYASWRPEASGGSCAPPPALAADRPTPPLGSPCQVDVSARRPGPEPTMARVGGPGSRSCFASACTVMRSHGNSGNPANAWCSDVASSAAHKPQLLVVPGTRHLLTRLPWSASRSTWCARFSATRPGAREPYRREARLHVNQELQMAVRSTSTHRAPALLTCHAIEAPTTPAPTHDNIDTARAIHGHRPPSRPTESIDIRERRASERGRPHRCAVCSTTHRRPSQNASTSNVETSRSLYLAMTCRRSVLTA